MLCSRKAECLSYNFCHKRICQLNEKDAIVSSDLLVRDIDCEYVGMHENHIPDCFDGKLSENYGENCDLEFKVGDFRSSECLNETNPIFNISEFEVLSERICHEIHCYSGERKVDPSLCPVELDVPFVKYRANYAGNSTWKQGEDYCRKWGTRMRPDFLTFLNDFGKTFNTLRRFDHPAFIMLRDVKDEGTWLDHIYRNRTGELIWDSNPEYQNSEDRDYGAVNGSVFQAYGIEDIGPDVLCARGNGSQFG
ncbi:uncharacterized protein LOC142350761 [Convolutriloba macropyga]|uniref:uncharacterized protein LOC142350761 n=1 Tax=Convolutriloba macropyga TaxID=536237 RepID=UPI003F5236C6